MRSVSEFAKGPGNSEFQLEADLRGRQCARPEADLVSHREIVPGDVLSSRYTTVESVDRYLAEAISR